MSGAAQALATLHDYVKRSKHWNEGGATRHDALLALGVLGADVAAPYKPAADQVLLGQEEEARPVGSINKAHLKQQDGPWCKEVLLYSPDNQGDSPGSRVMLYTAGRLDDALEWVEKGLTEWRAAALAAQAESRRLAAENRIAIGHLQEVLNKPRTHAAQQRADTAARCWLTSIGSEPV